MVAGPAAPDHAAAPDFLARHDQLFNEGPGIPALFIFQGNVHMKILVTGCAGKVGRPTLKALRAAGHQVTGVDIVPRKAGDRHAMADLTDFGVAMGIMSGIDMLSGKPDAVIHLAGIPAPMLTDDQRVFQVNTMSTYNVFSAASRLGVQKVVWASSETLFGLPFTTAPDFLPIDESHPSRPEWSYSLAKEMGERMADQFVRWAEGMSIISLRFSNVFSSEDYAMLPAILAKNDARKFNLWGYVDADDCAQACVKAVEADLPGHHRMTIAADDALSERPSAELSATFFPGVPLSALPHPHASLLSNATAERLIGYRPQISWRDRMAPPEMA